MAGTRVTLNRAVISVCCHLQNSQATSVSVLQGWCSVVMAPHVLKVCTHVLNTTYHYLYVLLLLRTTSVTAQHVAVETQKAAICYSNKRDGEDILQYEIILIYRIKVIRYYS